MIKAIFKVNNTFTFEVDGDTVEDIFQKCSEVQAVFGDLTCTFDGETDDGEHVEFVARDVDGDMFYELKYNGKNPKLWGCSKKFSLKKKPKGALYPRFKNGETGELLTPNIYKNRGWMKYDKETGETT